MTSTAVTVEQLLRLHDDKVAAIERELAMRRRVYRKRVDAGQMTQAEVDHQIRVFEAILDDYTFWLKAHPGGIEHARTVATAERTAATPEHQEALL